jgi:hypothetical protein
LIDRADAAMYVAKLSRPGGYAFHAELSSGRADRAVPPLPLGPRRSMRRALTSSDHERRHAQLQEANERLLLAALDAQALLAAAEEAGRRRAE